MLRPPEIKLPHIDIVPFWTNDFKRARGAYADGDYAQAAVYFNKSSDDGNMAADWYLGHMYRLGQGVPVDQATAYSYYSRVAENYDPEEPDKDRLRIIIDSQLRVADYLRNGIKSAKLAANPQSSARTYLRIATTYPNRAIAGLSMGGNQTLNIAIPHLEKFAYIGVFSSGIITGARGAAPAETGPFAESWEKQHLSELDNAASKRGLGLMWFSTGKEDFLIDTTRKTVELLKKHGFKPVFLESEGAHTWLNWRDYLSAFAPQLFQAPRSSTSSSR